MNNTKEIDAARRTALAVLAYADNTEKKLREKLARKGYSAGTVDRVIDEMKSYGYLNEERYIQRAAEKLADEKFYGKPRILAELRKKGFSDEAIEKADFSGFDFVENCRLCILKRGSLSDNSDIAALMRRGYSIGEIKAAAAKIKEDRG